MPQVVRQVRHAVVVSAAGYRIDEHLGQRPAEASSGPVTRIVLTLTHRHGDLDITLSDEEARENAHRAAVMDDFSKAIPHGSERT